MAAWDDVQTSLQTSSSGEVPLRILLLGRSGSGKSSSGNTILGPKLFKSPKRHKEKVTMTCEDLTRPVGGREVCVIDTPDLLDPDLSEDQLQREKVRLKSLCQAGLHAVLLVVPVGEDLQNEEEMLEFTKALLGQEVLKCVMLLFTMGDRLEDDETLEDYIREKELQRLAGKCGSRIHIFNNMEKDQSQVTELLEKINSMVKSNKGIFKRRQSLNFVENFLGADKPKLRLVLLGKTGTGKSASGNTILGRRLFESAVGSESKTKQCSVNTNMRHDKEISVIDTPGLFDNALGKEEVIQEIVKCLTLASPGPHAFVIVIGLGRFTPEEKSTVTEIKELFGESATKYTMVLFTHKDSLEGKTIDEFLRDGDADLKQLIKDCDGRFHTLDNRSQNYTQITELLSKIDRMVCDNGNTFYSDEMFEGVEQQIKKKQEENLEEKVKQHKEEHPEMSQTEWQEIYWKLVEESRSEAQESVFKEICAVVFAKISGKLTVTSAEKESAIKATESKGISRREALRLAVKATRKLAVKKVCKLQ